MRIINKHILFITLLCLCGCGNLLSSSILPSAPQKLRFSLEASECSHSKVINGPSLFLSDIESSPFIDSTRIVFSKEKNTRANYQFAEWVEPPARALENLLVRRLQCEGFFHSIEKRSSMVHTDYQLTMRLDDFFHNATTSPGYVQLSGTAEFIDLKTRKAISRKDFNIKENISAVEIQSAIQSFQKSTTEFLDAISLWLRDTLKNQHTDV